MPEKPSYANPMSRLCVTVEKIAKTPGNLSNHRDIWAYTFGADANATGQLLERIGDLIRVTGDARRLVESVLTDGNRDLHTGTFNIWEGALSQISLQGSSREIVNSASSCLHPFRFTEDLLIRLGRAAQIDEGLLKTLQDKVNELTEAVAASDLPGPAKALLTQRLEALREAILNIRLVGPDALERELDAVVGTVVRTSTELKRAGLFKGVKDVLDVGYKLVVLIDKARPMLEPAAVLLLEAAKHG